MKNDSSGTGFAIVMVLSFFLIIGLIVDAMEPKCIKIGCDNPRADGSCYCYFHKGSTYDHTYKYSGSSSSGNKKSTSSTGSTQSTTTTNHNTSESKKTTISSGGLDSYDAGYDDIYMDGDYDYDRYDSDDDYASGVDDAMEDAWEEYGEDW